MLAKVDGFKVECVIKFIHLSHCFEPKNYCCS
jgi:hypothetical protein